MITSLKIENFIIVDELKIDFSKGLQVLSGETGAGKSIIVGAIDLALGGSQKPGTLFDENKPAYIEIVFQDFKENKLLNDLIRKYDITMEDNELFIAKEIGTNLRSKGFINGRRVSQEIIAEFRQALLDFHSQRDQQKLLDQEYQLEVLDFFGNLEKRKKEFETAFRNLETKIRELKRLEKEEETQSDKMKLYSYQIEEIKSLQIKPKEYENLQAELNLLANAESILNLANDIEQVFYENENSVYDVIGSYLNQIEKFKSDNEFINETVNHLHDSLANLDEAVHKMRNLQEIINLDSSRLEEVQNRLDTLNSVMNKYKKNLPQLIDFQKDMEKEISNYSSQKERIKSLIAEISTEKEQIYEKALELSAKRKKVAEKFAEELMINIKKLAIPDAKVEIRFSPLNSETDASRELRGLTPNGMDAVDYYFSANKGIKPQPLRIAASGGELSRFLLTTKKILSHKLDSRTIIFDEIDAGIGGKTSELLAEFIYNIGKFHQVICITHLPQIAAYADRHFAINKIDGKKISLVKVYMLTENQRKEEIARMLAGSRSELALQHAEELLKKDKEIN